MANSAENALQPVTRSIADCSFFTPERIEWSMDINEILRIRERIEDSRRRIAAALDAARTSHRLMEDLIVKRERHRLRVDRLRISLRICGRRSATPS